MPASRKVDSDPCFLDPFFPAVRTTAVFRQDTDVLSKNCVAGDGAREGWIFRPFLLVTFLDSRLRRSPFGPAPPFACATRTQWASKEKLPGRRRRTEALLLPDMRKAGHARLK